MTEIEKYPAPPAWLRQFAAEIPAPDYQIRFLDKKNVPIWSANPGPQTWALMCGFEEMCVGGRRGGGKSKFLIAKPAMGDPLLPTDDPAHYCFLNDGAFRGLLLREEYQSMAEFVEEAIEFYRPFGGKPTGDPKQIDFVSGARIYFNHLGNEEAYTKYKGWNLTFIGIEELTQIQTLRRYLKLLGSLRSVARVRGNRTLPPLRTQIVSTTNPDGPGANWVKDRFVEVMGCNGKLIPWNTPMKDPITLETRIFIPFTIKDNPYLAEDTAAGRRYRGRLLAQDEVTRKQWMDGDWSAGTGKFFTEYRPNGPVGAEESAQFPWARHITKPVALKPWWYRWSSGDWGYQHPAAFHKFCRNESDRRVHVYDELQVRNMGSFELGALLAQWWHKDLLALQAAGQDPCVTIHLGNDAFSKDDAAKTKAQQIESGIKDVLGPFGALLLKYDETEKEAMVRNPRLAQQMFEARKKQLAGHICIALKPVYFDRVTAWDYVRDWIRFRPTVLSFQTDEARAQYLRDVLESEGREAYERHAADLRTIEPEVLPKVQIWECCVELDRCLRRAESDRRNDNDPTKISKREDVLKFNADENGQDGDDALESFRNGAVAFKEIQTTIPRSYFVGERMNKAQEEHKQAFGEELTDNTRLAMIAQRQNAQYSKEHPSGGTKMNFPRASSTRHRLN